MNEETIQALKHSFGIPSSSTRYVHRWNLAKHLDVAVERRGAFGKIWMPALATTEVCPAYGRIRPSDDPINSNVRSPLHAPSLARGSVLELLIGNIVELESAIALIKGARARRSIQPTRGRTIAQYLIIGIAILVVNVSCAKPPRQEITDNWINPHPKGSSEWLYADMQHRMDAIDPAVGKRWRQLSALQLLKVGMAYNMAEVGVPQRSYQLSGPAGSCTTYVHESSGQMGHFVTSVTVDDRTGLVTVITRESS